MHEKEITTLDVSYWCVRALILMPITVEYCKGIIAAVDVCMYVTRVDCACIICRTAINFYTNTGNKPQKFSWILKGLGAMGV
jgi:hypothetical protein